MSPIITLTTDFGPDNHYVAQMKAAVLSIEPTAQLVDVTHSIPPQQIIEGAIVMADSCHHFPAGTIHVGVVDPGVGTQRNIIAARLGTHIYIAPDNGLLTLVVRAADGPRQFVKLNRPHYFRGHVSHTFHGRDIMAPVAAYLARGVALADVGDLLTEIVLLEGCDPVAEINSLRGRCLFVDKFGNMLTNITRAMLPHPLQNVRVEVLDRTIPLVATYGAAPAGTLVALIGSSDRVEIAEVQGSAAAALRQGAGCSVRVSW